MAQYTAGDVFEIRVTHPTVGNVTFFCKAEEDGNLDLGGSRTTDDNKNVTGNGLMIKEIHRVLPSFESPPVTWGMKADTELQKLSDMSASPDLADIVISISNGAVWSGKGTPVGDLMGNINNAQIKVKFMFDGELKSLT